MTTPVHLVVLANESLWPALQAVVHWHRHAGGVKRLLLPHSDADGRAREAARRLERFAHRVLPEIEVVRGELTGDSADVRRQLEAWQAEAPEEPWVLVLPDALETLRWDVGAWLARPGCRVVHRRPSRDWYELREAAGGRIEFAPLTELRREATDDLPIAELVRALSLEGGDAAEWRFEGRLPAPLPLEALTEAAMANRWKWAEAFRAAGIEPGSDSEDVWFGRYVAALALSTGLTNAVLRRRAGGRAAEARDGGEVALWINHGGRLLVLDLALEAGADGQDGGERTVPERLQRAAAQRAAFVALDVEWFLIRPGWRLAPVEIALAEALGLRWLDQTAGDELPTRLAAWLGVPLSAEGADVERRLRLHLAQTGRTRVFVDEPVALLGQPASADPLWANTDGWLDRVMRDRGQNWLLWTHRGRGYLRVPAEGRASAADDWRQLVAFIGGVEFGLVNGRPGPGCVVVDFPEGADTRRPVGEWLRPFLNKAVTFAAAQARFAARARVEDEAAHAIGAVAPPNAAVTAAPAGGAGAGRAGGGAPKSPASKPAPPRHRPPVRREPRVDPLADLDRALDQR